MDNSYEEVTEPSTIYKFKLDKNTYLLSWSTTPWTKIGTMALAVSPDLDYVLIEDKKTKEFYILAESRLSEIENKYEIKKTFKGSELAGQTYDPHFEWASLNPSEMDNAYKIVADGFVTDDEGTGVVTLAVYGEDDYRVMQQKNIPIYDYVDEEGKLDNSIQVDEWVGKSIYEVNEEIDDYLEKKNLIYKRSPHKHKIAKCYRCNTRLYYAPLPAWFIDIQQLKDKLIKQNEKINWYPKHLKHGRFLHGLENAPDWNISRSRYWGTPMPIWQSKDGQMRIIESLDELKKWAVEPEKAAKLTDIHRESVDDLEVWVDDDKKVKGKRIPEVFDCWVESGSMPFAAVHYPFKNKSWFEHNFPAQFVSEYIAQTRAWFYTMHVMGVGIFDKAPFENVLTTGTVLAEDGSKMSKSKNNYPDPMELINKYGVDSLRLYLMSSPVMKAENLNFNEKEVADIRRKVFVIWWNMLGFYELFADKLLPVTQRPSDPVANVMDKWLLSKVENLIAQVTEYMDAYDVVRASRALMEFVDELSTWYLRLSRDRFRSTDNQQVSQVFGYTLYTLAQLIAPFAPFFAELVHQALVDQNTSIHHTDWPVADESKLHPELETKMAEVKKAVEKTHAARKEAELKLRQPLAKLTITSPVESPKDNLLTVIAQETNVKQVDWQTGEELQVELDTKLTPALQAEGQAREIVRNIMNLRKKSGCQVSDLVKVALPAWPSEFTSYIKDKALISELVQGEEIKLL